VLLMAAAVADFRPAKPADHKIKKTGPEALAEIELEPTEDILSRLATQRRAAQVLVGFAAEHGDGALAYGREKLVRKGLDVVVVNDISRADIGFDSDQNEVLILTRGGGEQHIPRTAKGEVADHVLDQVGRLREAAASAA
jgi:phosphopantothenoylcysteine decarboxylase/phosphopantothenate--cysteine ligase